MRPTFSNMLNLIHGNRGGSRNSSRVGGGGGGGGGSGPEFFEWGFRVHARGIFI